MNRSVLMAMAVAMAISVSLFAQPAQYRARLSMVPTDIPMQQTIAGLGAATASLKGSTLTINGTFSGLKTPATIVQVRRSAKAGMRGTPIGDLKATQETSGTISGALELTKEQ